jgi:hypothetical protein
VRNPGIQFSVWAMMIGTAVIACFLAFEIFLYDVATRQIVLHGEPSASEVFLLWVAMNLPIVGIPLLVAYAYFHKRTCEDTDRHGDEEGG